MKIVDLVKANNRCWVVFDEPVGQLTYEKHGGLLIGSDEQGIFYDCLYYDRPTPNMRAFAGREFDLPMKDGTVTHCNGQYWYGRVDEAGRVVGEEIAEIGASTKEELIWPSAPSTPSGRPSTGRRTTWICWTATAVLWMPSTP